MDNMDLDSEKNILEVQALPFLYDAKHQEYKNRQKRRDGWATVTANVIGEAWEVMDKERKDALGKEVQKKWISIKDCYYKNKKSQDSKSGDAMKPKKNYIYHKQLSFLQSASAERQTSGNMDNDTVETTIDSEIQPEEDNTEMTELENRPTTSTAPPPRRRAPQIEKQSPYPKKRRVDDFETKFLNVLQTGLQKSPPKESTSRANDPDEMFLLSQMPLIKNMSPADKMGFQMKYLQLVHSCSASVSNINVNFQSNEDEESVMSLFQL